jgi:hypothetical protein
VIRDLLCYGWDFWDYLDQHAHTETHAVRKALAGLLRSQGAHVDARVPTQA